jgi:hypothetical protein
MGAVMSIDQKIKKRAHELDPDCWVRYSGKPKAHKQAMAIRRTASLQKAADEAAHKVRAEIDKSPETVMCEVLEDLVQTCSGDPSNWLLHEIRRITDNARDVLERTS